MYSDVSIVTAGGRDRSRGRGRSKGEGQEHGEGQEQGERRSKGREHYAYGLVKLSTIAHAQECM